MRETRCDVEALLSHEGFLRALARSILRDESRADDVVQQTYLAALQQSAGDPGRLRAWLGRVARNFALRSLREARRRERREHRASQPEAGPSADEIRVREETRRRVVEAVLALDEPYRTTVVLRYLEELPPRKVARRLGVPVQTVYTRLKRALPLLRARFDDTWDGGRDAWTLALLPLAFPKSATAAPTVATKGVLLMSLKAKLAAATLLLAAGFVGYLALHERTAGEPAALHAQGREKALSAKGPRRDSKIEGSGAAGQSQTQAPPPRKATLEGIVRGGGKPLSGAVVQITGKGTPEADVKTGADGRFSFDAKGECTLWAAHPRWGPAKRAVSAKSGTVIHVDVDLPKSVAADLVLSDPETGAPVRGAEILVVDSKDASNLAVLETLSKDDAQEAMRIMGVFDSLLQFFPAVSKDSRIYVPTERTDAGGRVLLQGILSGPLTLLVEHPSYPSQLVHLDEVEDGGFARATLKSGSRVRVLGGASEAGEVCEVTRADLVGLPVGRATLDESGTAELGPFLAGDYVLLVSKAGTWRITNEAGKKGISIHSDPDKALRRKEFSIEGTAETVVDLRQAEESAQDKPPADATKRAGGAGVTGIVTGPDHEPLSGVQIFLVSTRAARRDGRVSIAWACRPAGSGGALGGAGKSGFDGRYSIEKVAPGSYVLYGAYRRYVQATPLQLRQGEDRTCDVRLDATVLPLLEVHLSDPAGRPADGWIALTDPRTHAAVDDLLGGGGNAGPVRKIHLSPGAYVLDAYQADAKFAPVLDRDVSLDADRTESLKFPQGTRVTLEVTGGRGPLVNDQVLLWTESHHALGYDDGGLFNGRTVRTTDSQGVVTFDHVPPGKFRVEVAGKEVATIEVGETPLQQGIVVTR